MNVQEMKGILAASVTPFDGGDEVNEAALRSIIRYALELGVAGFYVCGSTGEGFSLSIDERKRVVETFTEEVAGRAGVIVNISHMEHRATLELAAHAHQSGADAVAALPPIYYPASHEEVKRYYLSLLDHVALPMTIYNIPMLTGKALDEPMVQALVERPNFVGIKHASDDSALLDRFKRAGDGRLVVWSAREAYYVSNLAMGADGAIGSTYSLAADVYNEITRAFRSGDVARARDIQSEFNVVRDNLIRFGPYQSIKRCFTLMGIDAGACRPPFAPLVPEADDHLRRTLGMLDDLRRRWGLAERADLGAQTGMRNGT